VNAHTLSGAPSLVPFSDTARLTSLAADGSNASNCSSCEQPYDPAGWCEACRQFAHEELPEKTLAQWIAENREMAAAIRVQAMMALHREAMKSREAY
jgi:hypothetical protein